MKFKATKIATAVAAGLGLSVGGMNAANADTILFPHIVLSPTVTTILSVINDDFDALDELHYRYYYKQPPENSAACQEFDFWNPTSENDVVTFDMGAHFSGDDPQGVMFEPGRDPSTSNAYYVDDFAALSRQGLQPTRGYVLVDNAPRNPGDRIPAPQARLAGEAIIIEFITGSAWGYGAYNASEIWGFTPPVAGQTFGELRLLNQNDFSDRVELNGEVLTPALANNPDGTPMDANVQKNNFWVPIAIMPWDTVQSALFVTAVSTDMGTPGGYSASTSLKLRATAKGTDRIMFDRDERAYSGPGSATVTCVGRVDLTDMVGEIVKQSSPEGGWTNVTVASGQAIVFKGEINTDLPLGSEDVTGTFNNFYPLRKGFRESLGRPLAQRGADGLPWYYLPVWQIPSLDENAPFVVWENATEVPLVLDADGNPVIVNGNTVVDEEVAYNPANYADPLQVEAAIAGGNVFTSGAQ